MASKKKMLTINNKSISLEKDDYEDIMSAIHDALSSAMSNWGADDVTGINAILDILKFKKELK